MTLIVRPFNYVAGTFAKASEVNSNETTVYTAFNGNIGEANLTYVTASDGVRVWRAGPNAGGTNGNRSAVFSKSFALGAAASGNQAITFSTDCVYGNPAFSAAPTLGGTSIFASGQAAPNTNIPAVWISAITSTTATLQWDRTNMGGGAANITIVVTVELLGNV